MKIQVAMTIAEVDRQAWDLLDHGPSPFLKWGFLHALELSGSVTIASAARRQGQGGLPGGAAALVERQPKPSGWTPFYVQLWDEPSVGGERRLLGAVAAFAKSHSYGEYIFDFAWANLAERAGFAYYPKLVVAAPATPATGKRILLAPELPPARQAAVVAALADGVRGLADELKASSIHWLFCTADEQQALAPLGFWPQASFQFHWHNHAYPSFDAWTQTLASRKRKQLRKERSVGQGLTFAWVPGGELSEPELELMDSFYRNTTDNHGGRDYLQPGFFRYAAAALPTELWMLQAKRGADIVAGALFFETAHALYGRYWGCAEQTKFLHFETAYYQGIERAIAKGLPLFEAGAQGEHKLLRGFAPAATYSAHWVRQPKLNEVLARHCEQQAHQVASHMGELATLLPYRKEADD